MDRDDWTTWGKHVLESLHSLQRTVERVADRQDDQASTLVRNTVTLEEHVRRTDLLEQKVDHVESQVGDVSAHVHRVQGMSRMARLIAVAAGTLTSILGILKYLGIL